jgi:hypothetical protein
VNKAKLLASILVISIIICEPTFFMIVGYRSYDFSVEFPKFDSMLVHQPREGIYSVNATQTTWFAAYNHTLNIFGQELDKKLITAFIIDYDTDFVFASTNATLTIQRAINEGDTIKFASGNYAFSENYHITATIYLDNNTHFNGRNSRFIVDPNLTDSVIVASNCSYVTIQNCFIDGTGRNISEFVPPLVNIEGFQK